MQYCMHTAYTDSIWIIDNETHASSLSWKTIPMKNSNECWVLNFINSWNIERKYHRNKKKSVGNIYWKQEHSSKNSKIYFMLWMFNICNATFSIFNQLSTYVSQYNQAFTWWILFDVFLLQRYNVSLQQTNIVHILCDRNLITSWDFIDFPEKDRKNRTASFIFFKHFQLHVNPWIRKF